MDCGIRGVGRRTRIAETGHQNLEKPGEGGKRQMIAVVATSADVCASTTRKGSNRGPKKGEDGRKGD